MAMNDADDPFAAPPRKRRHVEKLPLDLLGVGELDGYIEELAAEIERVKVEIARKQRHRDAAHSFFKAAPGDGT
jgi:uncharacterized small protein (DUF1192 family)